MGSEGRLVRAVGPRADMANISREYVAICCLFGLSNREMTYGRSSGGRPSESRYIAMARGLFIVRATLMGAGPTQLARFLGVTTRSIAYWRRELVAHGMCRRIWVPKARRAA